MTRDEFVKKFKVGDKITCEGHEHYEEILTIGINSFFSRDQFDVECCWDMKGSNLWQHYKPEPKYKIMSPALYKCAYKDIYYVGDYLYETAELAERHDAIVLAFPACDAQGNPIQYRVPVGESCNT